LLAPRLECAKACCCGAAGFLTAPYCDVLALSGKAGAFASGSGYSAGIKTKGAWYGQRSGEIEQGNTQAKGSQATKGQCVESFDQVNLAALHPKGGWYREAFRAEGDTVVAG
jgi:hypothetical protein